jgi:hypothetical protein
VGVGSRVAADCAMRIYSMSDGYGCAQYLVGDRVDEGDTVVYDQTQYMDADMSVYPKCSIDCTVTGGG